MKTTLYYVRHGQSESNLAKIFTGQGNAPLTKLGTEQAERTAVYLKPKKIDRIYSSDLLRALQTAAPVARDHGLTPIPMTGLREISAGEWEGLPFDKVVENNAVLYGTWKQDFANARCPGGETVRELYDRITSTVEGIVRENQGKAIAVFSHAGPLRALWCFWNHYPFEALSKSVWGVNASVTEVEYDDHLSPTIVTYGYAEHLQGLITELPKNI